MRDWYPVHPHKGLRLTDIPPDRVDAVLREGVAYIRAVQCLRLMRRGRAERRDPRWGMARQMTERRR